MTRGGAAYAGLLSLPGLLGLSGLAAAALLGVAMASPHLRGGPTSLVVSAVTAAVAVVLMSCQPWWALLAKSPPRVFRLHWLLGVAAFALVGGHVAALVVLSPDDVWFAVSPHGPTRARMAVLATAALAVVVALGVARRVLAWSGTGFAVLHSFFAALALLLGVGHAVLTDGALEGWGTILLCLLGAAGAAGIVAARVRGVRLRRVGVGSPS